MIAPEMRRRRSPRLGKPGQPAERRAVVLGANRRERAPQLVAELPGSTEEESLVRSRAPIAGRGVEKMRAAIGPSAERLPGLPGSSRPRRISADAGSR